jgi:hypothetical protein
VRGGDYDVICPNNGQIVYPLEFASTVQPGMILKISIILRQDEPFQKNKDKCPQCHHNSWLDPVESACTFLRPLIINIVNCSYKCEGQFHVDSEQEGDAVQISTRSGDEVNEEHDRRGGGQRSAGRNVANYDKVVNKEIVSPALLASYVSHFLGQLINNKRWRSQTRKGIASMARHNEEQRGGDYSGIQHFRHIRIICMNNGVPLEPQMQGNDQFSPDDHDHVRFLLPVFCTFDLCPQDLTGQVTILIFQGQKYAWMIGSGAFTNIYRGEWVPRKAIKYLFCECHL